jgi:hypothetical protein
VNLVRWLATAPLAFLGYVVALLAVVLLTSLLSRLCPPDLLVSGLCTASWYSSVEVGAFALSTALGAALFVALPVLVAPSHRSRVAAVAFIAGAAYALWFLTQVGLGFLVPFCSAVASGALVAWLLATKGSNAA